MTRSNKHTPIFRIKAMYLGSEPMGELLENENGSDVIQTPLKRIILRTSTNGRKVQLLLTSEYLMVEFLDEQTDQISLPVEMLGYCGALRQKMNSAIKEREFETLDKSVKSAGSGPPLFATVFRNAENENTLYCHAFVFSSDEHAMELVRLMMQAYHDMFKELELNAGKTVNDKFEKDLIQEIKTLNIPPTNSKMNGDKSETLESSESIIEFLDMYNKQKSATTTTTEQDISEGSNFLVTNTSLTKQTVNESNSEKPSTPKYEVVSAEDVIKDSYNPNELSLVDEKELEKELEKLNLNNDDNPIVIKKKNDEQVVYKQNVFIRWLQPPTPPPPAPIIIREIQDDEPDQLPPIVIYKKTPRPETPPPLVIRERPPTPLEQPTDPLIIERRVSAPEKQKRKVVIEHLPAPPPRPRDIIIEKWIRPDPAPRPIYVEKVSRQASPTTTLYQSPLITESNSHKIQNSQQQRRNIREIFGETGEIFDKKRSSAIECSTTGRSYANDAIYYSPSPQSRVYSPYSCTYQSETYCSPRQTFKAQPEAFMRQLPYCNNVRRQPKIAGYRIIRQIIPGHNASLADINRAISSSQCINNTPIDLYSTSKMSYANRYESPCTDYQTNYSSYSGNDNAYGRFDQSNFSSSSKRNDFKKRSNRFSSIERF